MPEGVKKSSQERARIRRAGNARRAFRRRELRPLPERLPGEYTERAVLVIGLFFIITIWPATRGIAGSNIQAWQCAATSREQGVKRLFTDGPAAYAKKHEAGISTKS